MDKCPKCGAEMRIGQDAYVKSRNVRSAGKSCLGNSQILIYQNGIIFRDFLRHRLTQINTDLK